jgi:hypothetical protein
METINTLELRDELVFPDENILRNILGKSYDAYVLLLETYDANGMSYAWRYYRDGKAWLCKVQMKNRTIVWMSAWKGFMQAAIYFPEKYLERVYQSDIDEEVKTKIKATKNVGKSKPCIFRIEDENILNDFTKVMKLKIACK